MCLRNNCLWSQDNIMITKVSRDAKEKCFGCFLSAKFTTFGRESLKEMIDDGTMSTLLSIIINKNDKISVLLTILISYSHVLNANDTHRWNSFWSMNVWDKKSANRKFSCKDMHWVFCEKATIKQALSVKNNVLKKRIHRTCDAHGVHVLMFYSKLTCWSVSTSAHG